MAVNVSSCFVGGKASALAYAMLGLTKTITVIAIGVLYFDATPSYRVVFGGLFAIAASSCLLCGHFKREATADVKKRQ